MRRRDVQVLWLSYFDSGKTRGEGRRVPKRIAVDSPKFSELTSACAFLGLDATALPDARYSRSWWEKSGCVLVKSKLSKTEVLQRISGVIGQARSAERKGRR